MRKYYGKYKIIDTQRSNDKFTGKGYEYLIMHGGAGFYLDGFLHCEDNWAWNNFVTNNGEEYWLHGNLQKIIKSSYEPRIWQCWDENEKYIKENYWYTINKMCFVCKRHFDNILDLFNHIETENNSEDTINYINNQSEYIISNKFCFKCKSKFDNMLDLVKHFKCNHKNHTVINHVYSLLLT